MNDTITIETTARGLHALLDPRPTLRRQGRLDARTRHRPTVRQGKWVTATTTDRRRLAMQRREIAAPDGWSALVNVRDIKAIFATFKDTRANDPEMVLSLMAAPCASKVAPCSRVGSSARPSRSTSTSEYPEVGSLLTEAFGGTMQATSTSLNVAFLADFQQAARLNEPNMHFSCETQGLRHRHRRRLPSRDHAGASQPIRRAQRHSRGRGLFADPPKPKRESDDPSSSSRTKRQAVSA